VAMHGINLLARSGIRYASSVRQTIAVERAEGQFVPMLEPAISERGHREGLRSVDFDREPGKAGCPNTENRLGSFFPCAEA